MYQIKYKSNRKRSKSNRKHMYNKIGGQKDDLIHLLRTIFGSHIKKKVTLVNNTTIDDPEIKTDLRKLMQLYDNSNMNGGGYTHKLTKTFIFIFALGGHNIGFQDYSIHRHISSTNSSRTELTIPIDTSSGMAFHATYILDINYLCNILAGGLIIPSTLSSSHTIINNTTSSDTTSSDITSSDTLDQLILSSNHSTVLNHGLVEGDIILRAAKWQVSGIVGDIISQLPLILSPIHYGVYIGNNTLIESGPDTMFNNNVELRQIEPEESFFIIRYDDTNPEDIITRVNTLLKSKHYDGTYHILINNCQHTALHVSIDRSFTPLNTFTIIIFTGYLIIWLFPDSDSGGGSAPNRFQYTPNEPEQLSNHW